MVEGSEVIPRPGPSGVPVDPSGAGDSFGGVIAAAQFGFGVRGRHDREGLHRIPARRSRKRLAPRHNGDAAALGKPIS